MIHWLISRLLGPGKLRRWWYRNVYPRSRHWRSLRRFKMDSRGNRCERCGSQSPANHVHHLRYDKIGFEPLSDLQVLCQHCHMDAHA